MNKKGEFRLDSFLISLLIFSFIIAVGSGWITNMAEHYSVPYDSRFGATYHAVGGLENLTKSQKVKVLGSELPLVDILDNAIKGATGGINMMTAPIETVTLIAEDIETQIPTPDPDALDISHYVKVALTILVTFALIYLAFRIRSW